MGASGCLPVEEEEPETRRRGLAAGDGGTGTPRHPSQDPGRGAGRKPGALPIRVCLSPNHSAREALGEISALPGVERVALADLHGLE